MKPRENFNLKEGIVAVVRIIIELQVPKYKTVSSCVSQGVIGNLVALIRTMLLRRQRKYRKLLKYRRDDIGDFKQRRGTGLLICLNEPLHFPISQRSVMS